MANTYKNLGGGIDPAAATDTTLYTVPAATAAVVSSIIVCNTNATAVTIRIAVRLAGAAVATKHYHVYELSLAGNETKTFTLGVTLATTDIIMVRASATLVAFNAYGVEIT